MSLNPLQQYFRQPKIYVRLPSQGVYNSPGTIQGDINNLPVYGMTGMDEIIVKTPDALVTGESTVRVIESCCPSIKNAWGVSVLDTELLFTAIRIATYGNEMAVTHTCPGCATENDYNLDLTKITDHLSSCQYDNKIVLQDLIIKIQPLDYKQATEINIKNYEMQQKVSQAQLIEDETERNNVISKMFKDLSQIQIESYIACVESIETPNANVTERNFITEYLRNCDKSIFDAITAKIEQNRKTWKFQGYNVKCAECNQENIATIELDPSNFFV